MENNCLPKLALQYQPRGRKDLERPRGRWREKDSLKANELYRAGFTALNLQRS
jgi:hypothetical protein